MCTLTLFDKSNSGKEGDVWSKGTPLNVNYRWEKIGSKNLSGNQTFLLAPSSVEMYQEVGNTGLLSDQI